MLRADRLSPRTRNLAAGLIQHTWAWICHVGSVAPADERGQRYAALGHGSMIAFPPGAVFGEQWIAIGSATLIGPHCTLSAGMAPGHDLGDAPVVRIGDRVNIGRGSSIIGHHSIDIGDDVTTGPNVYVTDQNHVYDDIDVPIMRQWPRNDAVSIGAGTWLGTGVIVLPGAHIGRNVAVAAGSVVKGTFPDHCVIAGAPARIVRQHTPDDGWQPVAAKRS